jgi:two-component system response regulator RegA
VSDQTSLLVVEDDEVLRERLSKAFRARGFEVRAAATIDDARDLAVAEPPELVVLDLRVGQQSGLELISRLIALDPATRIVVLTGYGSIATALEAVKLGATHYLTKPADVDEILAAFDRREGAATVSPLSVTSLETMSLDRVEWEHINRVLVDCSGNVSEAARLLGLHRRTLQRKLAKFPSRR